MSGPRLALLALAGVLAAVPTVRAQAAADAPVLTLDAAVANARRENRSLQAQHIEEQKLSEQLIAFRSQRRPLFDVKVASGTLLAPFTFRFAQGSLGYLPTAGPIPPQDSTITTNPGLSTVVYASVVQPLTQLRRLSFGERAIARGGDLATEQGRLKDAELVTNVRKLYYGIVQADAAVRALDDSVRLSRELVRLVEQYEGQRVVLPADLLAARAGVLDQDYQQTAARRQAQGFREQLNALMNRPLDEPFTVQPMAPAPVAEADLAVAERQAVDARPEVRIGRIQAERAELALRAAKVPGRPDLSLTFQYTGFYNFEFLPHHGALVGVLATWEPWDWGHAKAEREEKRLEQTQAGLIAGDTETMIRLDVRTRFRALQDAVALIAVSDAAREAAREKLRVATERFAIDAALQKDVLEAQAGLAKADQARQQALANYWTARAEFERARADP